jgi:TolB-like protein/Tfp pilus assembly protein PilF
MDAAMSLLAELKRRNVIRMAGLYLVGAWLVVQVAATLLPVFAAPPWVMRALVGLLAIGCVAVLVFSWVYELTPEGIRRDDEVQSGASIAPQTARRMDRMLIVVLVAALGYFAVDKFVLAPGRVADGTAASTPAGAPIAPATDTPTSVPSTATPAAAKPADAKSIAVLAFADLSQTRDQEYFSDGVAEEILNALAKVEDLKVAGRTSSFYFKGRNEPLATIGDTLGVGHVLEGSVRKQGERLRISAKLLRVSDGLELWAETFDGTDGDIFALQENIARRVARELQVALDVGPQARLVSAGTSDPLAYELYLRASAIFDRRELARFPAGISALEQAIARDPSFARAHSRLALMWLIGGADASRDARENYQRVVAHAQAALAIDASLAEPHAAMGQAAGRLGSLLTQRESLERALQLDPDDVTTNFWLGLSLLGTGYREQGKARLGNALAIDPMLPNALRWRGAVALFDGDLERAEYDLSRAKAGFLRLADRELSEVAAAKGDLALAVRLWPEGSRLLLSAMPAGSAEVIAEGLYGDDSARSRALARIDAYLATRPPQVSGLVPLALYRLGQPDRVFALLAEAASTDNTDLYIRMWSPQGKALRERPGFGAFLEASGFVALWDQYGPPDLCRKDAHGEYRCE